MQNENGVQNNPPATENDIVATIIQQLDAAPAGDYWLTIQHIAQLYMQGTPRYQDPYGRGLSGRQNLLGAYQTPPPSINTVAYGTALRIAGGVCEMENKEIHLGPIADLNIYGLHLILTLEEIGEIVNLRNVGSCPELTIGLLWVLRSKKTAVALALKLQDRLAELAPSNLQTLPPLSRLDNVSNASVIQALGIFCLQDGGGFKQNHW